MKKFLLSALLCLFCLFAFACGGDSTEGKTVYTVTFRQAGQQDIVFEVEEGQDVENPPVCVSKAGYTVLWDTLDYTNIRANLLVSAVETANEYIITYKSGLTDESKYGYAITSETQAILFDESFTLYTPTAGELIFKGWKVEGSGEAFVSGIYTVAGNTTLVAVWDLEDREYSDRA